MNEQLRAAAQAWLEQDPDAETRAELSALLTAADAGDPQATASLHDRFDHRLTFGTAGLRGELAAGPNRMNRVTVAQAAAGLAAYLLERAQLLKGTNLSKSTEQLSSTEQPSVVIGYDGRKNSRVFAIDTAELMTAAGVRAIVLPRLLPTPVLAFAVRFFDTSAGVMVTASHNPPNDNGYKVYLGGADQGSQIVSPADAEIEAHILRVAQTRTVAELPRSNDYVTADDSVVQEYVRQTAALADPLPEAAPRAPLRYVFTALHGVGSETLHRVLDAAGLPAPIVVPEQDAPDGSFPTVVFPNPEEPGALDLAYATATAAGAELIIANDPDADRLGVAIPEGDGWRRLSGNEVGYLLGWRAARRLVALGEAGPAAPDGNPPALAASLVSSPALKAVADRYGLAHADTLTGFKWVSRVENLAYGYEEALGYLVDPGKVRDKDGVSAALDFLCLASELKAAGQNVQDHLQAFATQFGAFASAQVSIRFTEVAEIARIMAALRAAPPAAIGPVAVTQVDDFADGFGPFPASDILRLWLAGGSRVIVRPSGTEPKLKVYIDASVTDGEPAERVAGAGSLVAELEAGVRQLLA